MLSKCFHLPSDDDNDDDDNDDDDDDDDDDEFRLTTHQSMRVSCVKMVYKSYLVEKFYSEKGSTLKEFFSHNLLQNSFLLG